MDLVHVGAAGANAGGGGNGGNATLVFDLDKEIGDVGILVDRLGLGPSVMPAVEFVAIDDNQPTCVEPSEDPLEIELWTAYLGESWEAPATMQAAYDDDNPAKNADVAYLLIEVDNECCGEARRTARAACEILIGYARATSITPRDLCALFETRNPIIIDRMERASPPINLNVTPPPAPALVVSPPAASTQAETPRRHGRVLPAWMTAPTPTRRMLQDAGVNAVMDDGMDAYVKGCKARIGL
ncbi:unnamed protein product [Closterium sp. Naga37s-1]|nr:unnamed protein product [Closterium sp. Naga37s-1]